MIPKSGQNSFNDVISEIRNSNSSVGTAGDIRRTMEQLVKESDEVEQAVLGVQHVNIKSTKQIIESMGFNTNLLKKGMSETGMTSTELVDTNYQLVKQAIRSSYLLNEIRELQLGGRGGIFGQLKTAVKALIPFTSERRARIREIREIRRNIAINKLMRLTYEEQAATTNAIRKLPVAIGKTSQEEEVERKRFWERLFGKKKEGFGRKDMNDIAGGSILEKFFDLIPGGGLLYKALSFAIVPMLLAPFAVLGSYLSRGKWIAKVGAKLGLRLFQTFDILFSTLDYFMNIPGAELVKKIGKSKGLASLIRIVEWFTIMPKMFVKQLGAAFMGGKAAAKGLGKLGAVVKFFGTIFRFLGRLAPVLKIGASIGKVFGRVAAFIPFVNFIFAAFEAIRGIFLGMKKIGGVKGAITGLFGGILEFFTLGIFDMDVFLDKAKSAFEMIKNGEILKGVLTLLKAPLDGLWSGLVWLKDKVFSMLGLSESGGLTEETGTLGKILYWITWPQRKMLEAFQWLGKFIIDEIVPGFTKVKDFFARIIEQTMLLVTDPIQFFKNIARGIINKNDSDVVMSARERATIQLGNTDSMVPLYDQRYAQLAMDPKNKYKTAREIQAMTLEQLTRESQNARRSLESFSPGTGPMAIPRANLPESERGPIIISDTIYSNGDNTFNSSTFSGNR